MSYEKDQEARVEAVVEEILQLLESKNLTTRGACTVLWEARARIAESAPFLAPFTMPKKVERDPLRKLPDFAD